MNEYNLPKKALEYFSISETLEENELLFVKIGLCYEILDGNDSALKYYKNSWQKWGICKSYISYHIYDKMKNTEEIKWLEIAYEKEKENVDYWQK